MRTKRFTARVSVARYGEMEPELAVLARETLTERLSSTLRGPRGGSYEPVGDIAFSESEEGRDFMIGAITYRAKRMARYVRPKRVRP